MSIKPHSLTTIGWREWVSLPELNIPFLKAKVDTGAKTSCLHAFKIETFTERGRQKIRFGVHPFQKRKDKEIFCIATMLDRRLVSDSGGHREKRYVIETTVMLGIRAWPIEITLTDRDPMRFRMLLGRAALQDHFVVNPRASYLLEKPSSAQKISLQLSERKKLK